MVDVFTGNTYDNRISAMEELSSNSRPWLASDAERKKRLLKSLISFLLAK